MEPTFWIARRGEPDTLQILIDGPVAGGPCARIAIYPAGRAQIVTRVCEAGDRAAAATGLSWAPLLKRVFALDVPPRCTSESETARRRAVHLAMAVERWAWAIPGIALGDARSDRRGRDAGGQMSAGGPAGKALHERDVRNDYVAGRGGDRDGGA